MGPPLRSPCFINKRILGQTQKKDLGQLYKSLKKKKKKTPGQTSCREKVKDALIMRVTSLATPQHGISFLCDLYC